MSVSTTLRLGFCSALLSASCGVAVDPVSDAADATVGLTTSTPPLTGSSSTEEATESTPPPLLATLDEPFSLTISTKAESGRVIDGEFVSDEPAGAFRWSSRLDALPPQDFHYFLLEGQAEAGDYGCTESIKVGDAWYIRDTPDPEPDDGSAAFAPMDEAESAATSADLLGLSFPRSVAELFETIGMTEPSDSESAVFEVELTDAQVESAIEALWATWWSFSVPVSGTMSVTQNVDGHLVNVVLEAAGTGQRALSQSVIVEASINPLDSPMGLDSPRPDVGFCQNQTLATIGTWDLAGVVAGESGLVPVDLLPAEMATAFIELEADGSVAGSTGCRTFGGSVEFGYRRWLNPSLEFAESKCSEDQEELATELQSALLSGPSVGTWLEGTMWVGSEQTELVFVYQAK